MFNKKINKADMLVFDAVIKKLTKKHNLLEEPMLQIRAIWNVINYSKKHHECIRSKKLLGKYLNK